MPPPRLAILSAVLLAGALTLPPACSAQGHGRIPPLEPDLARLRSALIDHATALLERFGDTFYALGAYIDKDGTVQEITPYQWPELNAPPPDWGDSLVSSFHQAGIESRAAAILVDLGRSSHEPQTSIAGAMFHGETSAGTCHEQSEPFDWRDDGHITWRRPVSRTCSRRIFSDASRGCP
jgi:hypothetical protein